MENRAPRSAVVKTFIIIWNSGEQSEPIQRSRNIGSRECAQEESSKQRRSRPVPESQKSAIGTNKTSIKQQILKEEKRDKPEGKPRGQLAEVGGSII